MLVSRRQGRSGGRGGAGGFGGPGSRAAHMISRDLSSPHPNVSNPSLSAACVTHGSMSWRGRGGSTSVKARGSRALEDGTAPFSEKTSPRSLELDPNTAILLEAGPEGGMPSEACRAMVPKNSLALVTSPSPKI